MHRTCTPARVIFIPLLAQSFTSVRVRRLLILWKSKSHSRESQLSIRTSVVNASEVARPVDSGGSQLDLRLPQATRVIISVAQLPARGAHTERSASCLEMLTRGHVTNAPVSCRGRHHFSDLVRGAPDSGCCNLSSEAIFETLRDQVTERRFGFTYGSPDGSPSSFSKDANRIRKLSGKYR